MTSKFSNISHWIACAVVFLFPLLSMVLYSDFIRESEWNSRLGWVLLLGGMIYFLKNNWRVRVLHLALIPFMVTGSMDILYALTFGGVFTSASINAIFATDNLEFWDFMQAYTGVINIGFLMLYLALSFLCLKRMKILTFRRQWCYRLVTVLSLLLSIFIVQQYFKWNRFYDIMPGFFGVFLDYDKSRQSIQNSIIERQTIYQNSLYMAQKKEQTRQIYLIVMGESLSRNHLSVYGYKRKTTPQLTHNRQNSIVFTNAVSSFAQTQPSLNYALTERSQQHPDKKNSIMGVFKKAKFKTWWISNQQPMRYPTAALATLAEVSIFTSHEFFGVEAHRYDETLLPHVKKALNDDAAHKAIFVHLMGSHLQYKNRYPEEKFSIFQSTRDFFDFKTGYIDAYDNSVYYTDFILGQIWGWVKEQKEDTAISLIFTSDHGEEVFDTIDFKGHRPHNITKNMIEIPFVFLYNARYQAEFGRTIDNLKSNQHKPFILENLFHFVICSAQIETNLLVKHSALCFQQYAQPDRIIYQQNYDKGEIP